VKRLLALIAGGLGLGALWRRRARPALSLSPAEELRAKLAATRTPGHGGVSEGGVSEGGISNGGGEGSDVAARRADVHERARRTLDELGGS
jgi:uncharacterized membrane protein YgcG